MDKRVILGNWASVMNILQQQVLRPLLSIGADTLMGHVSREVLSEVWSAHDGRRKGCEFSAFLRVLRVTENFEPLQITRSRISETSVEHN